MFPGRQFSPPAIYFFLPIVYFFHPNYFEDSVDIGVLGSATLGVAGIGNLIGVYAEAADLLAHRTNRTSSGSK